MLPYPVSGHHRWVYAQRACEDLKLSATSFATLLRHPSSNTVLSLLKSPGGGVLTLHIISCLVPQPEAS
jgi:hypothetical protein